MAGTSAAAYNVVLYGENGMDSVTIGIIMSINSVIGMLCPPFFGMLVDRLGSVKKGFLITLGISAVLWLGIPIGIGAKLLGLPLCMYFLLVGNIFQSSANPFMDSWILQIQDAEPRVVYAHARKYGSLGYGIMCIAATWITSRFGTASAYFSLPICMVILLLLSRGVMDPSQKERGQKATGIETPAREKLQLSRIFKNYYLVTHFLFMVVVWMPFLCSYTTIPYLIEAIGGDTSIVGALVGIRAILEVPAFMLVPLIYKKIKPQIVLPVVFAYYALEEFALFMSYNVPIIITIMMVSGAVYAVATGINLMYVHGLAPAGLKSTVVTLNGAAMGLSGILGQLLVGFLKDAFGVRTCFMVIGIMVGITVVLMVLSYWFGKKKGIPIEALS